MGRISTAVGAAIIAVSLAAPLASSPAQASPIEITFSGVFVNSSNNFTGEQLSGELTFDPESRAPLVDDGASILVHMLTSGPYFGKPVEAPYVALKLNLPFGRTLTNSGVSMNQSGSYVLRNYQGENRFEFLVSSRDEVVVGGSTYFKNYLYFDLNLLDFLGSGQGVLADAAGGLRFDQLIDPSASRRLSEFQFMDADIDALGVHSSESIGGMFKVNSIQARFLVSEPGAGSISALALGLLCVARRPRLLPARPTGSA